MFRGLSPLHCCLCYRCSQIEFFFAYNIFARIPFPKRSLMPVTLLHRGFAEIVLMPVTLLPLSKQSLMPVTVLWAGMLALRCFALAAHYLFIVLCMHLKDIFYVHLLCWSSSSLISPFISVHFGVWSWCSAAAHFVFQFCYPSHVINIFAFLSPILSVHLYKNIQPFLQSLILCFPGFLCNFNPRCIPSDLPNLQTL